MKNYAKCLMEAVAGDEQALSALLEHHEPAARRWLSEHIPARWRSLLTEDDVLQQAYVDAVRAIHTFCGDNERSFGCWLETLAKRNLVDAIRMLEADKRGGNQIRLDAHGGDDSQVALLELLGGGISTPSRCVARQEASEQLNRALMAMPEQYRQVVQMYDLEGRSIQEVAAAMQRSRGATYMMRARAHRLLCELMGTASKYLSDRA